MDHVVAPVEPSVNSATGNVLISIDQVVHGYREGHRRLSGSIELDELSGGQMAVMSDLLAPLTGTESYLTGYPLKSASKYVLARTWLATEMKRPGCVWTHSLVMSYGALAQLNDPANLLTLLRRPTETTLEQYSNVWSGQVALGNTSPTTLKVFERLRGDPRAEMLLAGIYAPEPDIARRQFLIEADKRKDDESLALALWRQMWPRLRRSFFFATSIAGPVDVIDAELVLLFSSDPGYREPNAHLWQSVPAVASRPGFKLLSRDLPNSEVSSFRRFLWRYASDARDLCSVALPLADIYARLDQPNRGSIGSAAQLLRKHFARPDDCRLIKSDLLLGNISSHYGTTSTIEEFRQVLMEFRNLPNFTDETALAKYVTGLGLSTVEEVSKIIEASMPGDDQTVGSVVLRVLATELPISTIAATECSTEAKVSLARHNRGLIGVRQFWPTVAEERLSILRELAKPIFPRLNTSELLAGLAAQLGAEETEWILSYDPDAIGLILKNLDVYPQIADTVLRVLVQHPDILWEGLRHCGPISQEVLAHLGAIILDTDAKTTLDWPIWSSLTEGDDWNDPLDSHTQLAALLFKAALMAPIQPGARLLRVSFDLLHDRAAAGLLQPTIRTDLNRQLPFIGWFAEWDFCAKLRNAVATYFAHAPLNQPILSILMVSDNPSTLMEILRSLRTQQNGDLFLQELERQAALQSVETYRVEALHAVVRESRSFRWY